MTLAQRQIRRPLCAFLKANVLILFVLCVTTSTLGQDAPTGLQPIDAPAVRVDSILLTDVQERITTGLNLGVVVSNPDVARGIQKAADVWGLQADLFLVKDQTEATGLLIELAAAGSSAIITDHSPFMSVDHVDNFERLPVVIVGNVKSDSVDNFVTSVSTHRIEPESNDPRASFDAGFTAVRVARAEILQQIPKYDELFNIAFPISPLPDSFFQPTKFPYPEPLVRSVRTVSSASASAHAHTSCHMVALLGNMIHRTSERDQGIFLLGFEGGNVSIRAQPGAVTKDKISAVMTAYVFGFRGTTGERRHVLSENDGLPTSVFTPAVHAPEEFHVALNRWVRENRIEGYERIGYDTVLLKGFEGEDRIFRAALFMISSDRQLEEPELLVGVDGLGRWVYEFTSTQGFVQGFGEVRRSVEDPATSPQELLDGVSLASDTARVNVASNGTARLADPMRELPTRPIGGILTEAGALPGLTVGLPLGYVLYRVEDHAPLFQPYILALDGGFLSVTPETEISDIDLESAITRIDIDERGPLGSDQEIMISLTTGRKLMFRRTVLNFGYVDMALTALLDQAWIGGWEYVGARGRGLAANVVLYNFLGKNRKFMSSLNTWPSNDRPEKPHVRWYVDGMQRLNFSIVTPEGWRQEFVEVPLRVPPVPRDVQLFAGISVLD